MAVEADGSFGERLRRLREAAGLTQEELAERSGLTPNAIGMLERGLRRHPHPGTVRALTDALDLSGRQLEALIASVPRRGAAAQTPVTPPPILPDFPVPPTPIIGREREREEIGGFLCSGEGRLVTLTDPGGVGKSRLALGLARVWPGKVLATSRMVRCSCRSPRSVTPFS